MYVFFSTIRESLMGTVGGVLAGSQNCCFPMASTREGVLGVVYSFPGTSSDLPRVQGTLPI